MMAMLTTISGATGASGTVNASTPTSASPGPTASERPSDRSTSTSPSISTATSSYVMSIGPVSGSRRHTPVEKRPSGLLYAYHSSPGGVGSLGSVGSVTHAFASPGR